MITGCMFSGKTEELLRQLRRATVGGRSVLLIRPAVDTRTSSEIAESRSGTSFACTTVGTRAISMRPLPRHRVRSSRSTRRRCSTRSSPSSPTGSLLDGYEVIVSGLDTDFAGRPFGAMPTLLALADSVAKLTAICTFPGCGQEATRTQRLVNNQPAAIDDPLIVIGGTEDRREPDRYEARCRTHHRVAPARHSVVQAA